MQVIIPNRGADGALGILYKVTGVGSTDVESGVGVGAMESAVEASGLVEGDGVGMGEWQQKGHVIIIEDNSLK